MKSYSDLLIWTCHRRGLHAMGGMAYEETKGKKTLLIHINTVTVAELYIQRVTMNVIVRKGNYITVFISDSITIKYYPINCSAKELQ